VGRNAPYSLAELAQYVDLATAAVKSAPLGIGRNVEVFDRLRRWAYTAIADRKIGTHDAWHEAVARRASQIAVDLGAAGPRDRKENEVGHIAKSVARWVWERYVAGVPPLLRDAQTAAQRECERDRQKAREAARNRSRVTRDEYTAQARQRRSEATEMRRAGLSLVADGDVLAPTPSAAHGGAIAAAIVSEYAVPARSAEPESDRTSDGRRVRGETDAGESPIAYIQRRISEIVAGFASHSGRRNHSVHVIPQLE